MPRSLQQRAKVPLLLCKLLVALFLFPLLAQAQLKSISGTVTDESSLPVPGASVIVRSTNAGTKTDENGKWSLTNVAVGATLVFTSTTHETVEVVVDERTDYKISLKMKVLSMSDVVVVGYGRQKKVNLVGAVGTVNVDDKI